MSPIIPQNDMDEFNDIVRKSIGQKRVKTALSIEFIFFVFAIIAAFLAFTINSMLLLVFMIAPLLLFGFFSFGRSCPDADKPYRGHVALFCCQHCFDSGLILLN